MLDVIAKLKKVIWRSLENDFTIAAFEPEKIGPEFIATGDLFKPAAGITYNLSGKWEEHSKYGEQFKINNYCVQAPCDPNSISIYLEKYVKGVGPVLADKLIKKYGKDTIRILKKAPERVSNENKRVSYELALKISEQLQEDDKRQNLLIKLEGLFSKVKGLPKQLAQNILNIYGLSAYENIKRNSYQLTEMSRVGFVSADKIAMACGIKSDDEQRIKAGVLYIIRQHMQESGDLWISPDVILEKMTELIGDKLNALAVRSILIKFVKDEVLVNHDNFVTLAQYADDEDIVCECVGRFLI
ncbi:MAG: hypothetical protein DRJ10_15340 [Bacteroidetes bacterium]|nr:MAG: hypothetical protein DRJ10_15340 [Bacteroidota bacterium]